MLSGVELQYQLFVEAHFEEYSHWFEDQSLNRYLGPIGDDWLEAALTSKPEEGTTLAVIHADTLVAVADLYFGPGLNECVTAGLAVKPALCRRGYGTRIIETLKTWYRKLTVHVDPSNQATLAFLSKAGFLQQSVGVSDSHMQTLSYELPEQN